MANEHLKAEAPITQYSKTNFPVLEVENNVKQLLKSFLLASLSFQQSIRQTGKSKSDEENLINDIVAMTWESSKWTNLTEMIHKVHSDVLKGRILDLGCGRGNFVFYGMSRGYDVYGLDNDPCLIEFYHERIRLSSADKSWTERCQTADAADSPFPNDFFSVVHSNMVLEHIPHIGEALRETVRTVRRGGILFLKAQDARISWEGHYNIPWIPFMPEYQAHIWLNVFEKPFDYLGKFNYYTTPQIIAILEACGCQIVAEANPPKNIINNHWQMHDEKDIRKVATEVKNLFNKGKWPKQPSSLFVVAMKKM